MEVRTIQYLKRYCFDKAFISCTSLDTAYGIYDSGDMIAEFHRSILNCADKKFLIADHTKFDRSAFARMGSLDSVDVLVTDKEADEGLEESFKKNAVYIWSNAVNRIISRGVKKNRKQKGAVLWIVLHKTAPFFVLEDCILCLRIGK